MDSTARSMSRSGQRRCCGLGLSTNMISRILASWNQGNCLNGTKISRSSTNNQNPSGPTLLTSTAEMVLPRSADFIFVFPDQPERRRQPTIAKAAILSQGDLGFQPELRLPVNVLDMHMRPRLFTSEKEEAIPADAEDRRTHGLSIPECCFSEAQGDATALALRFSPNGFWHSTGELRRKGQPPTTTTAPVQNHQVFQKGLPASVESLGVAVEVRSTPAGFGASLGAGAIARGIDVAAGIAGTGSSAFGGGAGATGAVTVGATTAAGGAAAASAGGGTGGAGGKLAAAFCARSFSISSIQRSTTALSSGAMSFLRPRP